LIFCRRYTTGVAEHEIFFHIPPLALGDLLKKCSVLLKAKEDEIFNHPSTICRTYGAGRNTLSILRINPPKFGGGLKFESDAGIGQKGVFCKSLACSYRYIWDDLYIIFFGYAASFIGISLPITADLKSIIFVVCFTQPLNHNTHVIVAI
jgi:hypothetical protein